MDSEALAGLLRQLKEDTGLDYFLQSETGETIASTCSVKGKLLQDLAAGALSAEEIAAGIRRTGLDFAGGRCLLLIECEDLTTYVLTMAASAMFEEALEAESCVAEEKGRYFLLLDASKCPDLREAAELLQGSLEGETMSRVRIGVSNVFTAPEEMPRARQEAAVALTGLKLFSRPDSVSRYADLGLELAAMKLSSEAAAEYVGSVLGGGADAVLADDELLRTAEVFLSTGLNSAETARTLIVHRNTLNYRLDKIHRLCGLDLKRFDEAAAFRLASLVWQRLRQEEKQTAK